MSVYEYRRQERGRYYMAKAKAWIERNPKAWSYISQQAVNCAKNNKRFGMKELCEHVRWHMKINEGDEEFKLCNTYTAYFARILISEHPEVEPYITTKKAAADLCV